MKYNIEIIKQTIRKKSISLLIIFISYILLNAILNKTHITIPTLFRSFSTFFSIIFILTNLIIIPSLVSLTIVLAYEKIKDLKFVSKKKGSVPLLAIFATLLGGSCPGCFVGLFPAIIGLFGTTLTLGNLPLHGIEIQIISGIILIISIKYLTNPTVCKLNKIQFPN